MSGSPSFNSKVLVPGAKQGTAEIVLVKRALTNDEDAKSRVSTGASRPG